MKKALTKLTTKLYHYVDGERVEGKNEDMSGDCTGLRGDCSDLWGNCSGLNGNCTGLEGDCTGLEGDLDDCKITDEEREKGVNIQDLIKD